LHVSGAFITAETRQLERLGLVVKAISPRDRRGDPAQLAVRVRGDGMPEACALSLDNLTLVAKGALRSLICTLGPDRMQQVCTALRAAIDC